MPYPHRTLAQALAARADIPAARRSAAAPISWSISAAASFAPPVLIDMSAVAELRFVEADAERLEVGASVRSPSLRLIHRPSSPGRPTATWGRSAATCVSIRAASSTIRANGGAPPIIIASRRPARFATSRPRAAGVCFATFSGDLAPALLVFGAEVDLAGPPAGWRTISLAPYRL